MSITPKTSPPPSDLSFELPSARSGCRPLFNPTSSSPVHSRSPTPVMSSPNVKRRLYFDCVELPRANPPIVPDVVRRYWRLRKQVHAHLRRHIAKFDAKEEAQRGESTWSLGKLESRARKRGIERTAEEDRKALRHSAKEFLGRAKKIASKRLKHDIDKQMLGWPLDMKQQGTGV
ncbi:hypothetical protein FRC09_012270 [Ceratobasidium sp. 395]|nr:hypothetical protein FRC09_012270 [Ceratobasidium sp. 395]